jgi:flavodoxin
MSKKLVTYFSVTGTTGELAATLAQAAGADLYEIKPQTAYTAADLDWKNTQSRSTLEMQDQTSRPAVVTGDIDIADFEVVFVGFPVWWYTAPTIVNTFLESYDFSGKTLVPFATSGSSGLGKAEESLQASASGAAQWKEGKLLNGKPSQESLAAWVESLGL